MSMWPSPSTSARVNTSVALRTQSPALPRRGLEVNHPPADAAPDQSNTPVQPLALGTRIRSLLLLSKSPALKTVEPSNAGPAKASLMGSTRTGVSALPVH